MHYISKHLSNFPCQNKYTALCVIETCLVVPSIKTVVPKIVIISTFYRWNIKSKITILTNINYSFVAAFNLFPKYYLTWLNYYTLTVILVTLLFNYHNSIKRKWVTCCNHCKYIKCLNPYLFRDYSYQIALELIREGI